MLGGMAAKWRWRARQAAAGQPADRPNMVCGPVQVVWHKFAKYWDIEMREVPMSAGHYAMDADDMLARVDENTIMVVPTFGVTYTGAYEMVEAAGRRARHLAGRAPVSTSTSTSTVRAARSSPRSAHPTSCGTSGSRA